MALQPIYLFFVQIQLLAQIKYKIFQEKLNSFRIEFRSTDIIIKELVLIFFHFYLILSGTLFSNI